MKFQITLLLVFSFLQVQCTHKKVSEENVGLDAQPCIVGSKIVNSTGDVMEYTVKPDLRHWVNVPSAVSIEEIGTAVSDSDVELSCIDQNKFPISNNIFTLF